MNPRLKTSKKWTEFPQDFSAQIEAIFNQNFAKQSKSGTFKAQGRIYPGEILLRVGYLQKGRLKQINMELSVDLKPNEEAVKKIHTCVDAAGSIFMEYFDAAETHEDDAAEFLDLPLIWAEFPFEDKKVYLQYSNVNSDLESEADRILGLKEANLLQGEVEDGEIGDDEDDSEIEDVESEDDEESEPRMFGKIPKKKNLH